jgi:hypothetical protein
MSVVTFGTGFVGKVDRIPGKSYVVTKAFQIVNVPLVPLAGYVVAEGTESETFVSGLGSFEGTAVAVSWKSFGWGVARALMLGGGLLALIGIVPILLGLHGTVPMVLLGPPLGAAMLFLWWRTRRGLRASRARVIELESERGGLARAIVHRAS